MNELQKIIDLKKALNSINIKSFNADKLKKLLFQISLVTNSIFFENKALLSQLEKFEKRAEKIPFDKLNNPNNHNKELVSIYDDFLTDLKMFLLHCIYLYKKDAQSGLVFIEISNMSIRQILIAIRELILNSPPAKVIKIASVIIGFIVSLMALGAFIYPYSNDKNTDKLTEHLNRIDSLNREKSALSIDLQKVTREKNENLLRVLEILGLEIKVIHNKKTSPTYKLIPYRITSSYKLLLKDNSAVKYYEKKLLIDDLIKRKIITRLDVDVSSSEPTFKIIIDSIPECDHSFFKAISIKLRKQFSIAKSADWTRVPSINSFLNTRKIIQVPINVK